MGSIPDNESSDEKVSIMKWGILVELLGFVCLLCLGSFVRHWLYSPKFKPTLPWVGLRHESFSLARASIRQLFDSLQTSVLGYAKYGKHGQVFVMPDPSFKPQVLLPPEHIGWLIRQSESVLSPGEVRKERNGVAYLDIVEPKLTISLIDRVINPCLQRKTNPVQFSILDEIRASVDEVLGLDEHSWHEIHLHEALQTIINRAGTRAFFGLPLCRNQDYLYFLRYFIYSMGAGTLIVGQLPLWFFRPLAASLINVPLRYYKARAMKILVPNFAERIRKFELKERGETLQDDPEDFAAQTVEMIMKRNDGAYKKSPEWLAEQHLQLSFAALASTAGAATNLLLDILSSAPEVKAYENLREESIAVFKTEHDWGDPASLQDLVLTDSAIREGLRRHSLQIRGLLREVMPKKGITTPDGTHLPQGTWIGVPFQAVHMDDRFYTKPEEFDPFRFARMRKDPALAEQRLACTQASDRFLAFSYGRHACPGRWLVTQMLKLLMAYITIHYDIQPLDTRPSNTVFADTNMPSASATIHVRRRNYN